MKKFRDYAVVYRDSGLIVSHHYVDRPDFPNGADFPIDSWNNEEELKSKYPDIIIVRANNVRYKPGADVLSTIFCDNL